MADSSQSTPGLWFVLRSRLRLNWTYLSLAMGLLLVEIAIALWVRDAWIRPHGGDVLVVILIYCLIRAFLKLPVVPTALGVLAFSFLVEVLQYIEIVEILGLGDSEFWSVLIGTSLQWLDFVSYTLGIVMVLWGERRWGELRPSGTGKS